MAETHVVAHAPGLGQQRVADRFAVEAAARRPRPRAADPPGARRRSRPGTTTPRSRRPRRSQRSMPSPSARLQRSTAKASWVPSNVSAANGMKIMFRRESLICTSRASAAMRRDGGRPPLSRFERSSTINGEWNRFALQPPQNQPEQLQFVLGPVELGQYAVDPPTEDQSEGSRKRPRRTRKTREGDPGSPARRRVVTRFAAPSAAWQR